MTAGTTSPTYIPFRLTAGLTQSYPYKLQTLLTERYSAQTVLVANAGRAGENVADSRTRARFADALSEAMPEVAILMEGVNDLNSLREGMSNVTPIMGAMEDLVRDATGRGVEVFLATIPRQRPGQKNTQHADLVDKYNAELKVMASKKGATIVDVNALLSLDLIGQDGLHPTEEGYGRMAEIFLDAIKAKYEIAAAIARR
jgi:lysophospholipase L1-like esterase